MIKRKFVERLKEHCSEIKQKSSMALSGLYLNNYNCHSDFKSARFFFSDNAICKNLNRE